MSQAQQTLEQLVPGPLAQQGQAIAKLVGLAFPPALFQFKYMPSKLDRVAFREMVSGNQPVLALGFEGIIPASGGHVYTGTAKWSLLIVVRGEGTPQQRFFGDKQKAGVLLYAPIAMAVLQGQVIDGGGSIQVGNATNVVAADWGEDYAAIMIEITCQMTLPLYMLVGKPSDLGLFQEMAETWGTPGPLGNLETYTSDWKNPND